MKTVFMFSGQGAQYAGMGKDLYENYAVAKEVFDRADEVLGYSIKDICFSDEEKLGLTEFTQPAILTMSIAAMKVLQENGINADMTAGGLRKPWHLYRKEENLCQKPFRQGKAECLR